jgi:hypothetical protein
MRNVFVFSPPSWLVPTLGFVETGGRLEDAGELCDLLNLEDTVRSAKVTLQQSVRREAMVLSCLFDRTVPIDWSDWSRRVG